MIDLHTHIIPNVDDGSDDIEETFFILEEAKEVGFDKIVLTPHYIENYYEIKETEKEEWLIALSKGLNVKGIDIKLYIGNEVYFSNNIISLLKEKKISTINNSRYILFEIPLNIKPMNLNDIIFELLRNNYIPILAHPERYSCIQENPQIVYDLVKSGVLIQANYGSIIGRYGKKAEIIITKLFQNNLVHFLGSDVHNKNTIYKYIPEILIKIQEIISKADLEQITCLNPLAVLNNEEIKIKEPKQIKLRLKEKIQLNNKI